MITGLFHLKRFFRVLEEDLLSVVLRAFVNGRDEFDRFTGFGGAGGGLAAFRDCGDHFLEVALVLVGVDRGGIIGTESGFLALHEGLLNLSVLGLLVHEVPDFKGFVSEED